MANNSGWISLHRKIKDSPIYQDSAALHVWLHLLLSANHAENSMLRNGSLVTVKRGQLVTGRQAISLATGVHESKVQRTLELLEKMGMIEQQTNNKSRLISITNYDTYQDSEQQANNKRTTGEQQANTNNNINNVNNVNNLLGNAPPDGVAGKREKSNRGTRLPPDWQPDLEWTREQGLTAPDLELAKFRDYWSAQPGQKGVKLDWHGTWRNWVRRAIERQPIIVNRPSSQPDISALLSAADKRASR